MEKMITLIVNLEQNQASYEFMCDGNYYPVVRGSTRLDAVLDRKRLEMGRHFSARNNKVLLE